MTRLFAVLALFVFAGMSQAQHCNAPVTFRAAAAPYGAYNIQTRQFTTFRTAAPSYAYQAQARGHYQAPVAQFKEVTKTTEINTKFNTQTLVSRDTIQTTQENVPFAIEKRTVTQTRTNFGH